MGLYGDILKASDGSIFTFDKIYTITSSFFTEWEKVFENSDEYSYIEEAKGLISDAEKDALYQEASDYARVLSQKHIMSIVRGLASGDDVFVGRYILVEGVNWVFTKIYRDKKYEYVKVADLNTLNLLNEANTDEWLNVEQKSSTVNDIRLIHADPAPPLQTDNGEYIYPTQVKNEKVVVNNDYFKPINEIDTAVESKGWQTQGIMSSYFDGKGHQVKDKFKYEEKYRKLSDQSLTQYFDRSIYYVAYYYDSGSEIKHLYTKNTESTTEHEIAGYIKLTQWNSRSDTDKGTEGKGIQDNGYNENYRYYLRIIVKSEVSYENDGEYLSNFTHLVSENDDYTLILNGGYYLNNKN